MKPLEAAFKKAVIKRLKSTDKCYFFVKEALGIRGIADIIGCINGRFFAWELKRNEIEGKKTTGRIVLQKYNLSQVEEARGVGAIVYPGNFEEEYNRLLDATRSCVYGIH